LIKNVNLFFYTPISRQRLITHQGAEYTKQWCGVFFAEDKKKLEITVTLDE